MKNRKASQIREASLYVGLDNDEALESRIPGLFQWNALSGKILPEFAWNELSSHIMVSLT